MVWPLTALGKNGAGEPGVNTSFKSQLVRVVIAYLTVEEESGSPAGKVRPGLLHGSNYTSLESVSRLDLRASCARFYPTFDSGDLGGNRGAPESK